MRKRDIRRRARPLALEKLESRRVFDAAVTPHLVEVSLGASGTGFEYSVPSGAEQSKPLPWAGLNQVTLRFDQSVVVTAEDLSLTGVRQRRPVVDQFRYDDATRTAQWTFQSQLSSDRYALELSDRVVGVTGLPLDGEWRDGQSARSGDGTPGGDFRYFFNVLVGDVDQDGRTSLSDYHVVNSRIGQPMDDLRLDVDTNGLVDANDLQWVQDSYGGLDGIAKPNHSAWVRSIGDRTGDGLDEFVTLSTRDRATLSVHDTHAAEPIRTILLHDAFRFVDVEPVFSEGNGAANLVATLGVHRQTGGIRVWVWDLQTGLAVSSTGFNKSKSAEDLEVFTNPSTGLTEVAVLTRAPQSFGTRVYLASLGARSSTQWIDYGRTFEGFDLEVLQSSGSMSVGLAVAGVLPASDGTRVKVFDRESGQQTHSISFGRVQPVDFEVFVASDDQPRLAMLRRDLVGERARVDIRDLQGTRTNLLTIQSDGIARDLEVNSEGWLAVATEHAVHHEVMVHSGLHSDNELIASSFGSGFAFDDLAIGAIGSDSALLIAQQNRLLGAAQVKLRNANKRTRIASVPLNVQAEIPEWFGGNRVHGHTRLSLVDPRLGLERSFFETTESDLAAQSFKELGANLFTRHALTMDEDPWWPSEYPVDAGGNPVLAQPRDNLGIALNERENLVQEFINSSWEQNLPMIGYYFDITDATAGNLHPEWGCHDFAGGTLSHRFKGDYLDITGPYGDVVQQRLLELADMGISGLYLDFRHLPAGGCWGSQLESDFTVATGLPAPPIGNTAEYRQFAEFSARRMTEVIAGWEQRIHQEYPHVQLIVSVTTVPALTRLDMNTELVGINHPKSEFPVAIRPGQSNRVFANNPDLFQPPDDVRMALGWTLLRDSAEKGVPHIWNAFTPNRDHLLAFVGAVTTYGSIAAVDVPESLILPGGEIEGIASRDDLAASFALGETISPHLSGTESVKWAAVLFSEQARNARGIDSRQIWEEVNLPTVGAFHAVQRSQLPVGVLTDQQLLTPKLHQYKVLLVPSPDDLTMEQQAAIDEFIAAGGAVIENEDTWDWSSEMGYTNAVSVLQTQLQAVSVPAPISVLGLPEGTHSVAYQKNSDGGALESLSIAITNQFDFSQSSSIFDPIPATEVNPTPENISAGARLMVDNHLDPEFAGLSATEIVAFDVVSGSELAVTKTGTGFEITLPEIQRMALVVVEPLPSTDDSQQATAVLDVNGDRQITAVDALLVINALAAQSPFEGEQWSEVLDRDDRLLDTNGDQRVTALDALLIVNQLSKQRYVTMPIPPASVGENEEISWKPIDDEIERLALTAVGDETLPRE